MRQLRLSQRLQQSGSVPIIFWLQSASYTSICLLLLVLLGFPNVCEMVRLVLLQFCKQKASALANKTNTVHSQIF